jgi:hypothetical protein
MNTKMNVFDLVVAVGSREIATVVERIPVAGEPGEHCYQVVSLDPEFSRIVGQGAVTVCLEPEPYLQLDIPAPAAHQQELDELKQAIFSAIKGQLPILGDDKQLLGTAAQ